MLLARLSQQIVGVKYYQGLVGFNEQVNLVREPGNKYDMNAIRAMNMAGVQIGHVRATIAQRFARLVDAGLIRLEGTMMDEVSPRYRPYELQINIYVYGRPSDRASLTYVSLCCICTHR